MPTVVAAGLSLVGLIFYVLLAIRPVTVDVSPHVAFAPASVVVSIRVEPNAENRDLIVEASGGDYRRSDVQLEGDRAPIRHTIQWKGLGAGEYHVSASVVSRTYLLGRATTNLRVIGRDE